MMKRNLILLSMLAMLVGVTSCSVGKSGTENIVFENQTTEYLLKDFTKIDANGIVKIVLKQGSVWNIRVVESNNPNLKTIVKKHGETLQVYTESKRKKITLRNVKSPIVYITMPKLRGVKVSGATKMEAGDFTTDDFRLEVLGASKVTFGNIVGKTAKINCSGANNLKISVKAESLRIENSGASNCNLTFEGNIINSRNSGAGNVDLNVCCKELTATSSGAATTIIRGTANKKTINTSGMSKVNASRLKLNR